MSNNNLDKIPIKYFEKVDGIKTLNIGNNSFKSFPLEVLKFKNIEKLGINNNSIDEIPDEIIQLNKLETLDIRATKIKAIPSLKGMTSLKLILAVDNGLTDDEVQSFKCNLPKGCELLYSKEFREYPPYQCNN